MPTPDIRRIYGHPWRDGRRAEPGQTPTRVEITVRPQIPDVAHETVLVAFADATATGASVAGTGPIAGLGGDAGSLCFAPDETLKRPPGPAVEPGVHALVRFDRLADVRQLVHGGPGDACGNGRANNGLARFVMDVLHAPRFVAGYPRALLRCALAGAGPRTAAQDQESIAPPFAAEGLAQAVGSKMAFADIHSHRPGRGHQFDVAGLDGEVEQPLALGQDDFGWLGSAALKEAVRVSAGARRDGIPAIEGDPRPAVSREAGGVLVEMHVGTIEADFRGRRVFLDTARFLLGLVRLADRDDGVAAHPAALRRRRVQAFAGAPVRAGPVSPVMRAQTGQKAVAGRRVGGLPRGKCRRDADEQVDAIRWHLPGKHWPSPFRAGRLRHRPGFLCHRSRQHIAPILRIPAHRVRHLTDVTTSTDHIDPASCCPPHGALRAPATLPAIHVAGFLAEVL